MWDTAAAYDQSRNAPWFAPPPSRRSQVAPGSAVLAARQVRRSSQRAETRQYAVEQSASAAANGVFIAAINRVGTEAPWNIGEFYGSSYFVNLRGQITAQTSPDQDELLIHEMDMVRQVGDT